MIDLDDGKYWPEVSDDKFYVPHQAESEADRQKREAKEDAADEEERKRQEKQQALTAAARASASSSSSAAATSFDMSKLDIGEFRPKRARFAAFKEMALKPVTLEEA